MFRPSKNEMKNWILRFATSNPAFTEHGAVAAAFVLNSPVAVSASIRIVRAFDRLRRSPAIG